MKNIRNHHRLLVLGTVGLLGVGAVACNDKTLENLTHIYDTTVHYVDIEARVCTAPARPVQHKLKYLFILDHSASNKPGYNTNPLDVLSTDPSGGRRYGPLVQFVQQPPVDPNNLPAFSLIDFSDTAYPPGFQGVLVGGAPAKANPFTTDANAFLTNDIIQEIGRAHV